MIAMIDYDTAEGNEASDGETAIDAASPGGSPSPRLIARPLSARGTDHHRRPGEGEVHVWRFQSHWVPVQSAVSHAWLSSQEWESARRHTAPAARRRFLTTRVALRWLLSGIADLAPNDPLLHSAQSGRFDHPERVDGVGGPLFVDVVQAGAWTLIGIASEPFTLACTVKSDDGSPRSRISGAETGAAARCEEAIDLPMPAPVQARIVCAVPPLRIRGFGWRAGEVLGTVDAGGSAGSTRAGEG